MTMYTYYHNPKCSKSREGLQLLEARGINFDIKLYLVDQLQISELEAILKNFQNDPIEKYIRIKEDEFKLIKDPLKLTIHEWAQVIRKTPKLLERPILFNGKKAAIGRPVENLLSLLD